MRQYTLLWIIIFLIGCNTLPDGVKSLNAVEAKEYIKMNKDLIVVDVRTPKEIEEGKLPQAIAIDVKNENFRSEIEKLDKTKSYLLYCKSGIRSGKAAAIMKQAGFNSISISSDGYAKLIEP